MNAMLPAEMAAMIVKSTYTACSVPSPPHSELLFPCYTTACEGGASHAHYFVNWPVRFAVLPFDAYGNRRAGAGKSVSFIARIAGPRHAEASAQLRCAGEGRAARTAAGHRRSRGAWGRPQRVPVK